VPSKLDGALLSEYALNREIAALRTVFGWLETRDLLPHLRERDLKLAFAKLPVPRERIVYLSREECQALIEACARHDSACFEATREEHAGARPKGSTPRHEPATPIVRVALLTGMRLGEVLGLTWGQVDFVSRQLHLGAETKTRRARDIDLDVCPSVLATLAALASPEAREGRVFTYSQTVVAKMATRLVSQFGAPEKFGSRVLRHSCASFLTCAPGIFGAASAFRSARQFGYVAPWKKYVTWDSRRWNTDMLTLCQWRTMLDHATFDAAPMLLNTENGILDLRTGTLGPHDPDQMCTRLAPVDWDPDATYRSSNRYSGTTPDVRQRAC
jgi:hypothetical protein